MWWIRKNGAVEGPLSSEQVEKRIKLNMLGSLDRISNDGRNWQYVRDTSFWGQVPTGNPTTPSNSDQDQTEYRLPSAPPVMPSHTAVPQTKSAKANRDHSILFFVGFCIVAVLGFTTIIYSFGQHGKNPPSAPVENPPSVPVENPPPAPVDNPSSTPNSLSTVYQSKQQAIGLVAVTFQAKNGNWKTESIGTAFAIDRKRFVTNAHVAYGVKNCFETVLLPRILEEVAKEQRKSFAAFLDEIGESGIEKLTTMIREFWKVRDIEIRLNHSNGKRFRIAKVQVHPRYNPAAKATGEFDVAVFEISGSTDCYFGVASKKELHSLHAGIPVASAGFPTEGLNDLNIEKPEASYATGDIKKITDFDNKDAGGEYNRSIIHSIPAGGGASGSPIFTANGKVIAVLWGGNNGVDAYGNRIPSGVLQNFAVRIDQIDDVDDPVSWSDWINGPTK